MRQIVTTAAVVFCFGSSIAAAQDPGFVRRGIEIRADLVRTPSWSFETRTGEFLNRRSGYDAGSSVALGLGVTPISAVTAFGSLEWNGGGFGDTSGFTVIDFGLRGRLPTTARLVPSVLASAGKFEESGGVWFSYLSAGAGVDWYLSRTFSFGLDVRRIFPLSVGSEIQGSTTTLDADLFRIHLGFAAHFGW